MREYTIEIKALITHEICEEGQSTSEVAKKYEIPLKTVEKWVTNYNKDNQVYKLYMMTESEQINQLKKENQRLRRDNEILKKTIKLISEKK